MTRKEFNELHVGDYVVILEQDLSGLWAPRDWMTKYCGRVAQVISTNGDMCRLDIDQDDQNAKSCGQRGWWWYPNMISKYGESPEEFECAAEDVLF